MENNQMKLLDGYYKVNEAHFVTWKVDGEKIDCKDAYDTYDYKPTLHYGDFGTILHHFIQENAEPECHLSLAKPDLTSKSAVACQRFNSNSAFF